MINSDILQVIATREGVWSHRISFYGRDVIGNRLRFIKPVELEVKQELGILDEPFMTLEIDAAQQLMDSLWDCGLRPSEGSGSAGALAATQKHLEDMRKLVFEK